MTRVLSATQARAGSRHTPALRTDTGSSRPLQRWNDQRTSLRPAESSVSGQLHALIAGLGAPVVNSSTGCLARTLRWQIAVQDEPPAVPQSLGRPTPLTRGWQSSAAVARARYRFQPHDPRARFHPRKARARSDCKRPPASDTACKFLFDLLFQFAFLIHIDLGGPHSRARVLRAHRQCSTRPYVRLQASGEK